MIDPSVEWDRDLEGDVSEASTTWPDGSTYSAKSSADGQAREIPGVVADSGGRSVVDWTIDTSAAPPRVPYAPFDLMTITAANAYQLALLDFGDLLQVPGLPVQLPSTTQSGIIDGSVETIPISENSAVKAGDVVATMLTKDGQSVELKAAKDGVVTGIDVPPGFPVDEGAAIMTIEDTSTPLLAVIYVPLGAGKTVNPGMTVQLSPSVTDVDTYGYLLGTVNAISEFPVSQQALAGNAYLGGASAAEVAGSAEPMLRMIITLDTADTTSGYRWSSSSGPDYQLHNGTATEARVVVAQSHPINYFLPINR